MPPRYAYDIDPETFSFNNRRVFAYIDAGGPDGIQVDTNGNVYIASGDGVQVSSIRFICGPACLEGYYFRFSERTGCCLGKCSLDRMLPIWFLREMDDLSC